MGDLTRDGHFPQQVGIDAYGNSGFRFADMSHRGSLLCLPTGMFAWPATVPGEITIDTLAPVLAAAADIEVLMIGLGHDITGLAPEVRAALREHGIIVEAITTGSAVRTYNVLLAEERAVAAALLAVERVR